MLMVNKNKKICTWKCVGGPNRDKCHEISHQDLIMSCYWYGIWPTSYKRWVVVVDFSQNFCSYQKKWALMSFWEWKKICFDVIYVFLSRDLYMRRFNCSSLCTARWCCWTLSYRAEEEEEKRRRTTKSRRRNIRLWRHTFLCVAIQWQIKKQIWRIRNQILRCILLLAAFLSRSALRTWEITLVSS